MGPNVQFEKGAVYHVCFRNWDNNGVVKARRMYIGKEERFGDIPCHVFSARLRKGKPYRTEVSVPHYDLVAATAV